MSSWSGSDRRIVKAECEGRSPCHDDADGFAADLCDTLAHFAVKSSLASPDIDIGRCYGLLLSCHD
jgi:hypothetical protein